MRDAALALMLTTQGLILAETTAQHPQADKPASQVEQAANNPLRLELLRMARDDQETTLAVEASKPSDPNDAAVVRRSGEVHQRNTSMIKRIVAEHGWPGRTLVGTDGAHAAWLLVQHADDDLLFQKECLELVRQAFETHEVTAQELAYLTDRVADAEKRPQMYGTQGIGVSSPEDEARVDANRMALGLEPWRVFSKKRRESKQVWLPEIKPD